MNTLRNVLKLTTLEHEILQHRLVIGDCIAGCFLADDCQWTFDEIVDVADLLANGDLDGAVAMNQELAFAVLQDAVEGSTYLGAAIGNVSDHKFAAIERAGESLADKVGRFIEKTIYCPCG